MEQTQLYHVRLTTLKIAVKGFANALKQDISKFDKDLQDLIRNGQVQKFEYTAELTWKVLKQYLFIFKGIDENSPKAIIKAFFRAEKLSTEFYEALIRMIDHRNQFSHVYDEAKFLELHSYLVGHAQKMQEILEILLSKNEMNHH